MVFVASRRNEYHIEQWSAEGVLVRTIVRPLVGRARTANEIDAAKRVYALAGDPGVKLPKLHVEVEPLTAPIHRLACVGDELWVTTESDPAHLPDGCMARIAVHNRDGALVEDRWLKMPMNSEEDYYDILADGRIARRTNLNSLSSSSKTGNVRGAEGLEEKDRSQAEVHEVVVYEAQD